MRAPIQLLPPSQSLGRVKFAGKLKERAGSWIVWWYGTLAKNILEMTVPLNNVLFRELLPDGSLGSTITIPVGMTHLGSLRLGSVWTGGALTGHVAMSYMTEKQVSYTAGDWGIVSAGEVGLVDQFKLRSEDARSFLLRLKCEDGLIILVPCTEFFVRGYGRSTETSRSLITYNWATVQDRFYFDQSLDPEKRVRLKHHVKSSEAVFLHHALYDEYTKSICERIHSNLQTAFENQKRKRGVLPSLDTGPWFEGPALIEGKGVWLEPKKTFLLLDIRGLSDPAGDLILIERQGTEATGGESGERIYTKSSKDIPVEQELELELTDSETPQSNTPTVFYEPFFKQLGEKRRRKTVRIKKAGKRGVSLPGNAGLNILSTGDAHGRGKGNGVGKGEGNAPEQSALQGALADMWKSCIGLKAKYPDTITKVEWFNSTDGYVEGGNPNLEPLRIPGNKDSLSDEARAWTFLSSKTKNIRGALIIRMTCGTRTFFVLDIQRKPRYSKKTATSSSFNEERYRGLIVELPNDSDAVKIELQLILKKICIYEGRIGEKPMSNYVFQCFNHNKSSGEIPFESHLIRTFRLLDMHFT